MTSRKKLIRITTVASSMSILLKHQLKFMSQHYNITAISAPGTFLEEVKQREGVEIFPVEMTRSITPLKDLQALHRLYRLFRKEKPVIVHTHTPKAGLLGMLAAKIAGVPVRMHTVAGMPLLETTGMKRKMLDLIEKFTSACATMVYPNSTGLKEIIIKNHYAPAGKVKVIGKGSSNGIDTVFFAKQSLDAQKLHQLKHELQFSEEHLVFCFVGRIVTDKGINELGLAFKTLHKKYPAIRLLIVGDYEKELDPVKEETEELIKTHPAIKWVGFQPDVRPYLAISDVFVFPSYREGFPQVVMQAAAMELPCVVSDINGCNEIIQEGVNGLIIPTKDAQALGIAMERMITDGALRKSFASVSREMIIRDYEQRYLWNEILKEYQAMEKTHAN